MYNDSMDRSSEASSDFFSPTSFSSLMFPRTSLLTATERDDRQLPLHHDTSWIGARLSPICSFENEEDDDDDDRHTAVYHRALHLQEASFINEKSRLLRKGVDPRSKIHPMWDTPPGKNNDNKKDTAHAATNRFCPWGMNWGTFICIISGMYLTAMGCFDLYMLDQSKRSGSAEDFQNNRISNEAWMFPWLAPFPDTLLRFGALLPSKVFYAEEFWRILTSAVMPCSLVEWLLVVTSWRLVLLASPALPRHRWAGVYCLSTLTGQIWMLAWDPTALSGCVSWGTCAVLVSLGVVSPSRRLILHLKASALIVMVMLERPHNSVLGIVGSCFFGWAWTGANKMIKSGKPDYEESFVQQFQRWFCRAIAVSIIVVPMLWVAI
jgi:hypothetical protein